MYALYLFAVMLLCGQVWFRAVPSMHQALLRNIADTLAASSTQSGMVSVQTFCTSSNASNLPLSQSECFMLAQLLTRRRPNNTAAAGGGSGASGGGASGEGGPNNAFVDIALLQRIKTGDFLHAALV